MLSKTNKIFIVFLTILFCGMATGTLKSLEIISITPFSMDGLVYWCSGYFIGVIAEKYIYSCLP